MDDHAVLSAVEGVDEKVAVGLPLGKPNQAVSRRVSGRSNRPARRNATTAAMFQVLSGIVCGAIIGLLIRRYLNNRSAGHDAGESVSPQSVSGFAFSESEKIQIQVAPPESAPALNARLAALTESNADLKQQVIHAAKTSAKLWNLIDALRVENEQTKSLVRRETCDVEKLAPICAALNDEPQTNIPTRVRQRTSDLRLRRLWGTPADDPSPKHPRELLVVTVGEKMMANVNEVVLRFDPVDVQVVLFHYDGNVDVWNQFPWSKNAIHISAHKQSKWWFAKRFLHPDVVEPYERVWVWDEDIDVTGDAGENINGETTYIKPFDQTEYVRIVTENGLEISQPALISGKGAWPITRRVKRTADLPQTDRGYHIKRTVTVMGRTIVNETRFAPIERDRAFLIPRRPVSYPRIEDDDGDESDDDGDIHDSDNLSFPESVNASSASPPEMHRFGVDWRGQPCLDKDGNAQQRPPCAAYVEIMVPVFSRRAWRCAWSLIQNDLTHGWGLDLVWSKCAADPENNRTAVDNMGVVDAQGVRHLGAPTLAEQGESTGIGTTGFQGVQRRRAAEWDLFNSRWKALDVESMFEQEEGQIESVEEAMRKLNRVLGDWRE